MSTTTNEFHEANKASEILYKIGKGAADADFARAVHQAIDRAQMTMKKCKVRVEVEIEPDDEIGCLMIRADVSTKLAKLPPPASQMHLGPNGELLTQQEFLLGGGKDEAPLQLKPKLVDAAPSAQTPSGRFPVSKSPTPAPVAPAPTPKPVAGKDQATEQE